MSYISIHQEEHHRYKTHKEELIDETKSKCKQTIKDVWYDEGNAMGEISFRVSKTFKSPKEVALHGYLMFHDFRTSAKWLTESTRFDFMAPGKPS